jgi:hypothetical protein
LKSLEFKPWFVYVSLAPSDLRKTSSAETIRFPAIRKISFKIVSKVGKSVAIGFLYSYKTMTIAFHLKCYSLKKQAEKSL